MPSLPFEDENLPLFTVGQVSSMLEIQQAFLRRLDEHDVVRPSRSSGRQRRYTRNEITVIQYVVRLADEGMTLPSIRRVLELEQRIRELESECDALRAALRDVRGSSGRRRGRTRPRSWGQTGPRSRGGPGLHLCAVEVQVGAGRRGPALVLVTRAVDAGAVRVLRG